MRRTMKLLGLALLALTAFTARPAQAVVVETTNATTPQVAVGELWNLSNPVPMGRGEWLTYGWVDVTKQNLMNGNVQYTFLPNRWARYKAWNATPPGVVTTTVQIYKYDKATLAETVLDEFTPSGVQLVPGMDITRQLPNGLGGNTFEINPLTEAIRYRIRAYFIITYQNPFWCGDAWTDDL